MVPTGAKPVLERVEDDNFHVTLWAQHMNDRACGYNVSNLTEALKRAESEWARQLRAAKMNVSPATESPKLRQHDVYKARIMEPLTKANRGGVSGHIPHEVFRERLRIATLLHASKEVRCVLRMQLLQCQETKDVKRVVAVALQRAYSTQALSSLYEPLMRALFRSRQRDDDRTVLVTLTGIIARFRVAGAWVDKQLIRLGLKFAARVRSLDYMKRYLRTARAEKLPMTAQLFRSLIAKFSIGCRGLGEIRNGRWRRSELLQILTGFDDCRHLPPEAQFHLETWLSREDWQFVHGWIAALARCRDRDRLAQEWELWKRSDDRTRPKRLQTPGFKYPHSVTSKTRGDRWFLEQMCIGGALDQAWAVLRESELVFKDVRKDVKHTLLEGVEHAGCAWNEDVRLALIEKYDQDLCRIEKELRIAWVPTDIDDEAEGYHFLLEDQEEVLDRLGSTSWKLTEDYGYPYDEVPAESLAEERSLHDAASTTPATMK